MLQNQDLCESRETRKPIAPFAPLLRVLLPQIFCNGMSFAMNRYKYISETKTKKENINKCYPTHPGVPGK